MMGMTTDSCVTYAALHGIGLGYEVYVVVDASGTGSLMALSVAISRMATEGAKIMTWWGVGCELLVDTRNPEGEEFGNIVYEALPWYGALN